LVTGMSCVSTNPGKITATLIPYSLTSS
jgi:hypothetical protein